MITAKEARNFSEHAQEVNSKAIKKKLEEAIKKAADLGHFACSVVGLTSNDVSVATTLLKEAGFGAFFAEDMRDHDWSVKISW